MHRAFFLFRRGCFVVALHAFLLVLDVLAVRDDEEQAEQWPLDGIAQILEGTTCRTPRNPLPARQEEGGKDCEDEEENLNNTHAQWERVSLLFVRAIGWLGTHRVDSTLSQVEDNFFYL